MSFSGKALLSLGPLTEVYLLMEGLVTTHFTQMQVNKSQAAAYLPKRKATLEEEEK